MSFFFSCERFCQSAVSISVSALVAGWDLQLAQRLDDFVTYVPVLNLSIYCVRKNYGVCNEAEWQIMKNKSFILVIPSQKPEII